MAKPNFILPNKPAIKAGSILSYNYTDDLTFAAEPLDFSRNSSATRVNEQGLIEEVGYFGPQLVQNGDFSQESSELVTNGDFATDTNWTKYYAGDSNSITIANGVLSFDGNTNENVQQTISSSNLSGFYKVTYTITSYTRGNPNFLLGGGSYINLGVETGTFTKYVQGGGINGNLVLYAGGYGQGGEVSIDNVSVKEVGQDWVLGTGWGIGTNKATSDASVSSYLNQALYTIGNLYKLKFEVLEGTIELRSAQYSKGTGYYTTGVHEIEVIPTTTSTHFYVYTGFGQSSITNVSVIEVLGDKPRIDYSDSSTEPSLLLEPQSTNSITYSEDFANAAWRKYGNTVVTSNTVISPNGTLNGSTVSGLSGAGSNDLRFVKSGNTANNTYTYSVYLKGSGTVRIQLSNGIDQGFDNTITLTSSWKRHFLTSTFNSTTSTSLTATLDDFYGQTATQFDIWGAQLEQLSYPTSYIPTSGSTATRLGETADNAGGAGVFNSEEGVLYAEIAALANNTETRHIEILNKSDESAFVRMKYGLPAGRIECQYRTTGYSIQANLYKDLTDSTEYIKIAFKWQLNNFSLYINGTKISENLSGNVNPPNTFDDIRFGRAGGTFYGKTKNIQVFNYALTDEELQTLTT